MSPPSDSLTVAEQVAHVIAGLPDGTPPAMQAVCQSLLVDITGLCIAARHSDFMQATFAATDEPGACRPVLSASASAPSCRRKGSTTSSR